MKLNKHFLVPFLLRSHCPVVLTCFLLPMPYKLFKTEIALIVVLVEHETKVDCGLQRRFKAFSQNIIFPPKKYHTVPYYARSVCTESYRSLCGLSVSVQAERLQVCAYGLGYPIGLSCKLQHVDLKVCSFHEKKGCTFRYAPVVLTNPQSRNGMDACVSQVLYTPGHEALGYKGLNGGFTPLDSMQRFRVSRACFIPWCAMQKKKSDAVGNMQKGEPHRKTTSSGGLLN